MQKMPPFVKYSLFIFCLCYAEITKVKDAQITNKERINHEFKIRIYHKTDVTRRKSPDDVRQKHLGDSGF
jgi:hypothetical protein